MRKQLYVIRAGKERFLIASDAERTTFLSKLNTENEDKSPLNDFFEKNIDYVKGDSSQKYPKDDDIFFLNDINKKYLEEQCNFWHNKFRTL